MAFLHGSNEILIIDPFGATMPPNRHPYVGTNPAERETTKALSIKGIYMNLKSVISTTAFLSFGLIFTILNTAKAAEQTIATITTDCSQRTYKLIIDTNDDREIKGFYKDVYDNGKKISRSVLNANKLNSGVILEQRDKYVILRLKSNNFDQDRGGIVTVDTLYNGATGERRGYELAIAQSPKGWALFKQSKAISLIQIQTNRVMMLGEVGIKNLVMK
jgi:hypothetical protein